MGHRAIILFFYTKTPEVRCSSSSGEQKERQAGQPFLNHINFKRHKKELPALRVAHTSQACHAFSFSFLFLTAAPLSFCPLPSFLMQRTKIQPLPCKAHLRVASGFGCLCLIAFAFLRLIKRKPSVVRYGLSCFLPKTKRQKPRHHYTSTYGIPRSSCLTAYGLPPSLHSQDGSHHNHCYSIIMIYRRSKKTWLKLLKRE